MFFKKQREAAKAKAAEAQKTVLDTLQKQIDDALAVKDPAERLLKLEETRLAVTAVSEATVKALDSKSKNKIFLPYFGVVGSATAAGAAAFAAFAVSPALLVLIVIPTIVGGLVLGGKRTENFKERGLAELKPFLKALKEKKIAIATASEKTVREDIAAIAASPRFAEVQGLAVLRDSFMRALQQNVLQQKPQSQPKKPGGAGFNI